MVTFKIISQIHEPSSQKDLFDDNSQPTNGITDMEDFGKKKQTLNGMAVSHKRKRSMESSQIDSQAGQTWREILGPIPLMGNTKVMIKSGQVI